MLFKNTFIYTVLQLVNKGIPFLLLPVLTRFLSTEDYGIIAAYNTFVAVAAIFIGLSLPGAVSVNYFQQDRATLQKFIGNAFNILVVTTLLSALVIAVLQERITTEIELPAIWMYAAILVVFFQNLTGINLTLWRSEQRAKPFAYYEMALTTFNIAVSLLLIVGMSLHWEGRTAGTALAAIAFGLLSLYVLFRRDYVVFNISVVHIKDALKFGVPLIPHQAALWMRSGVDVFLITSLVDVTQTGLYSVGYQLGAVIGIIAHAFNNAYSPYLYQKLKNVSDVEKMRLVKFTYLYFVAIVFLALILSALFAWMLPFFLGESFQEANRYISWIALAYAFNGMYMMVVNYIFYVKKNHLIAMVTLPMSLLHVALSYYLITVFGAIGAAYASVVSFGLTFFCIWILSSRVFQMPWKTALFRASANVNKEEY